jgi:hypothetical protein
MTMNHADCVVIASAHQVVRLTLPKRHRFVIVVQGETPVVAPIKEPGTYEIDIAETTAEPAFPAIIMIVRARHTRGFENMSTEEAGALLRKAVSVVYGMH